MRMLVGSDIGSYVFVPATRTINILDVPYELELKNILISTNVESGSVIYNFAKSGYGGSISDNVLVLDYDTTSMLSTDELQIWVDIPENASLRDLVLSINKLQKTVAALPFVDRSLNRARASAVIESGTVTTVTTCGTVNTLTNLGMFQAQQPIFHTSIDSWANNVRRRFT